MRKLEDEYFEWLLDKVKNKSHGKLLRLLFNTEFYFLIPMDENRALDGIDLRYDFIYEKGMNECDFPYLDAPCNVFEMIFALAFRISLIMDAPYKDDDTHVWFWRMISNLGLNKQTDRVFDPGFVNEVILHFLNRHFGMHGEGSIFSTKSVANFCEMQFWDQAMLYLNEFDERRNPHGSIFD